MLLQDRVAIVSGIGPGMGRSIALRLAASGADVVLAARSAARLEEVAGEVRALGRRATCVPTDLTDPAQCRALVERAVAEHGRVDVLVNNAFHPGTLRPFADDDLEDWRGVLEVNLLGTLRVTQAVVPRMRESGGGSIVMISTMSSRVVNLGFSSYAASKSALNAATQGLARELGRDQIRVNAVLPGYIWGESVQAYIARRAGAHGKTHDEVYAEIAANIPIGRIPEPDEIAGAVLFFASDLSCVVTGQTLDVNGGQVMY